ncbi:MAG: S9 family peptidase [Candidatus Thorarchaeota archaeon]|nr:MAG: S9 family peptidase [Candidatus Thorarchaeota archaeon]
MTEPPVAKKKPREFEIHGVKFRDDYFWLREKESEEVVGYLEAENAYVISMTSHTADFQHKLFEEMKGRIKETDESVPMRIDDYYYYHRTEEGKNYQIHCRRHESMDAPEEIILDENLLAEGREYMKVSSMKVSPDHKLVAYSVDFTGGETFDIHVVDLDTRDTIDTISKVAGWSSVQWDVDSTAVFYPELDDIHRQFAVSRHVIGTDQEVDERLIEEGDKSFITFFTKSRDMRFIFFYIIFTSEETTEIHFMDLLKTPRQVELFMTRKEGIEFYLDHHDGYFYFITNVDDAINFKMMRTKVSSTERENWEQLIGHDIDVRLTSLSAFLNFIVIWKREGGYENIMIYDPSSGGTYDISLPEEIYGLQPIENPVYDTNTLRFAFSSPVTPKCVYDYDMSARKLELKKIDEIKGHDAAKFITERRYALSEDGTRIPISIAYKKGVRPDGKNPLLLYGYGSYGSPADPHFDFKRLSLIERGVIFAIAHIRGGGEYGKPWYHAGKLAHKMNTFTDFIACAEFLIGEGYTSNGKLCAIGGSAGGLLIGSVLNLRPNLFGCAVAAVPFVDVINTMLDETIPLTTFEFKEWGNPKIKEEFEWIMEYSPYDNVEAKEYPPILITAGINDPRVQFWEPAKWTAKLRALKTDKNPLFLKTEMSSGHGMSSGRYDFMKDWAFIYSFVIETLGLPLE